LLNLDFYLLHRRLSTLLGLKLSLLSYLSVQNFVVVVEIFRESGRGQVFDLRVEYVRNRQTIFLENVEEENELILSLLTIVYVFLELHQ